jgi:hypothetical protein
MMDAPLRLLFVGTAWALFEGYETLLCAANALAMIETP